MASFRRLLLGLMLMLFGALAAPAPSIEPHSPIDIVVDTLAPQAQAVTSSQRALLRRGISPVASWDASTGTLTSLAALVTATRTSNATMFDSTGKLTYAPNNMLTYSNTFNNAAWTKNAVTLTTGISDPLGGTNATTVTATTGGAYIYQRPSFAGGTVISAFYIRRRSGSGAVQIAAPDNGSQATIALTGSWQQVTNIGAASGSAMSAITITTSGDAVDIYAPTLSAVTYETTPRTADQVITTSAAYYGPRIDYTYPSTPGLLVEGSFAELLLQTGFASGWTTTRATLAGGVTTGVDGTTSAATLIEDATASNTHVTAQSITFASGSSYVFSAVAKAKGRNWVALRFPSSAFGSSITASFDLSNGVVGTVTSGTSGIISLGSGWYRCWLIASATASVSASPQIYLENADNSITYTGDGTSGIYVSDANTGVGTAISSIIKATSTSVTRAADALAAAAYSSNPAIIQYRAQSTGARARKKLTTFSSISSETAEWIEAIRVYPVGTSSAYLDAHLTVDGAW